MAKSNSSSTNKTVRKPDLLPAFDWNLKNELRRIGRIYWDDWRNEQSKKAYFDFVLMYYQQFDIEAWEIFIHPKVFFEEQMKADIDFWTKIYQCFSLIDLQKNKPLTPEGRERLRIMKQFCENIINPQ